MAIEATVTIKNPKSKTAEFLWQLSSLRKQKRMPQIGNELRLDCLELLIEQNIHGIEYRVPDTDIDLLRTFEDQDVLTFTGLRHPDIIGNVRYDFIRLIKHCAEAYKQEIDIWYFHDRGDLPYETANWYFNYSASYLTINEMLEIKQFDGGEKPIRSALLKKTKDGFVTVVDFEN